MVPALQCFWVVISYTWLKFLLTFNHKTAVKCILNLTVSLRFNALFVHNH